VATSPKQHAGCTPTTTRSGYRIDKLESILGPSTEDARLRLDVQFALLVLGMRGLDDGDPDTPRVNGISR